jgi:hypothetical protein
MMFPITSVAKIDTQLQAAWGDMIDVKREVYVTIQSATEEPLRVMCTAWEVMLGNPEAIIKGNKELNMFGTMRQILEAQHKTVMEYVGLSMSIIGARLPYLTEMAACRAGFSVMVQPADVIDEPIADQMVYNAEVGCTFRALYDWLTLGKHSSVSAEHILFAPLIAECVREYDDYLGSILEGKL